MNEWLQAIATVGFPICAAAYMAYLNREQTKDFAAMLDKQNAQHEEEVSALTLAINNNTQVITILTERMAANERS